MFILAFTASVYAQPTGSAAKGGSRAPQRGSDPKGYVAIPDTVKYRAAMKELELNEELLVSQVKEASAAGPNAKLKQIILAYLLGRTLVPFEEVPERVDLVLLRMRSGVGFDASLRAVFVLPPAEFKTRKKAAEGLLKNAMKR